MKKMSKLQFKILKKKWNARVWQITLNGITLTTPVFMPVGTRATIKGLILDLLRDPKYIGALPAINLILANTFHLYLRPGDEIVKQAGWLHQFENRDQLILTDSWWYQVFSLWLGQKDRPNNTSQRPFAKVSEQWVKFRSPYDGSEHRFTPEKVIDIQANLWSDIMMVLDVCSPAWISAKKYYQQMQLTHRRAKRAFDYFLPQYDSIRWVLFPIVQWGTDHQLRKESLDYLKQFAIDWIAVGGVSVWESKELVRDIVSFIGPQLPEDKPRYLMGVWTHQDIVHAVANGFDMFDCVLPTRLGRHGLAMTSQWNIKLSNAQYKNDFTSLDPEIDSFTSRHFTKAYLHHLIRTDEILGGILLSLHNIVYLHHLVNKLQQQILDDKEIIC